MFEFILKIFLDHFAFRELLRLISFNTATMKCLQEQHPLKQRVQFVHFSELMDVSSCFCNYLQLGVNIQTIYLNLSEWKWRLQKAQQGNCTPRICIDQKSPPSHPSSKLFFLKRTHCSCLVLQMVWSSNTKD